MPDEFDLIARYFTRPAGPGEGVWLGIGDDAAILDVPPGHLVVDAMICHPVPLAADAASFGSRVMAEALTHLAASGARPRWATLALTLPAPDEPWLEGFSHAFLDTAHRHQVDLVGGDTTRGPAALAVAAFGLLPGEALRRPRVRPGDRVMTVEVAGSPPEAPVRAGIALRPLAGAVVPTCDGDGVALRMLLDDSGPGTTLRPLPGRVPDPEPRAGGGRLGLCFTLAARHEDALREGLAHPRHRVRLLGTIGAAPPRKRPVNATPGPAGGTR